MNNVERVPAELPVPVRRLVGNSADARLSIGLGLPLDNDLSRYDQGHSTEPRGVPSMTRHGELARLAERLGFDALWIRDIPTWDQEFGDAGQLFDPFVYLGWLGAATKNIVLGTAGIVLPVRHPLHVAKAISSAAELAPDRIVFGIATGDRPAEFARFGVERAGRAAHLRSALSEIRGAWAPGYPEGSVLPKPHQPIPVVMTGRGGQDLGWIASQTDGWFVYPDTPEQLSELARRWRSLPGGRAGLLLTALHIDLAENPEAPPIPIRRGYSVGAAALTDHLQGLARSGFDHVQLILRSSRRPLPEVLKELATSVLPEVQNSQDRSGSVFPGEPAGRPRIVGWSGGFFSGSPVVEYDN